MINYFELKAWYNENKEKINDSIVKNIYKTEEGIMIEIYKQGLENRFLYLIPGKILFLYNIKEREETDNFILKLRKDFVGKRIYIKIDGEDKILIIDNNEKRLYIELFPNGLIVITDINNKIIYANKYKDFGVRKIYKNEEYRKPPKNLYIYYNPEEFCNKIYNSNKKDIVRTLSIDFSLGGKYSEYILNKLNIEKSKKPQEVNIEDCKKIFSIYINIVEGKLIIDENYNLVENINSYFIKKYFSEKESKKLRELNEKKEKINKIIEEQKSYLKEIEKDIKELEKIAQFLTIYSWIFDTYNIEDINKKLGEININANIRRDNEYIIIDINDEDLKNII